MRVIPVLDLLNGVVVRAVAGDRGNYQPLVSQTTKATDPVGVAQDLHARFGLQQFYLADLDAILHRRPNSKAYRELADAGFDVMIDAGLRTTVDATALLATGAGSLIVGLETWPAPASLRELSDEFSSRVVFSLDLRHGQPLRGGADWSNDPAEIAHQAIAAGVTRMIVLDLAQVGTGGGLRTRGLCQHLRREFPQLELITGGGVRSVTDLQMLATDEVDGVLVASALHNGQLSPADVLTFGHADLRPSPATKPPPTRE